MKSPVSVSVIIVSFNTCDLLRNCLRSVYEKTEGVSFEVIVSDNGSEDGSIEMVKQEFPQVVLLENRANLGFGTGNNRGLDVARGEYIFYLNSDTLLLNNALKIFYDYWNSHAEEDLGVLGCNLMGPDNCLTESHGKFPQAGKLVKAMVHHLAAFGVKNVMKFLHMDYSKLRPRPKYERFVGDVEYVVGADMFMKNSPAARFDENFFLYFEETDLQWRLSLQRQRRVLIDGPEIVHLVQGGKRPDDIVRYGSFSMIQSEISKVRYTKKNLSRLASFLLKGMIFVHWLSPYIFKNTRKYFGMLWRV